MLKVRDRQDENERQYVEKKSDQENKQQNFWWKHTTLRNLSTRRSWFTFACKMQIIKQNNVKLSQTPTE